MTCMHVYVCLLLVRTYGRRSSSSLYTLYSTLLSLLPSLSTYVCTYLVLCMMFFSSFKLVRQFAFIYFLVLKATNFNSFIQIVDVPSDMQMLFLSACKSCSNCKQAGRQAGRQAGKQRDFTTKQYGIYSTVLYAYS